MAGTPNIKFNSGAVPHGGIYVDVYRPIDPENPNGGGTKLATMLCESCSPKIGSTLTTRPDIDGGPNGWFIVNGNIEGNVVLQRGTAAMPTLENGDYFDAKIRVDAAGAGIAERFVIHSPDIAVDAGYRKISASVIVDKNATGVAARDPLNGN